MMTLREWLKNEGLVMAPSLVESVERYSSNYAYALKTLEDCKAAFEYLPEGCLGYDHQEGWPYRDELLHNINKALDGEV